MNQGLLQRAEGVFLEVVELPRAQRGAAIRRLCGSDEALRAEVESILEHHEDTGEFLRTSDLHRAFDEGPLLPATRIGEFTVLGVLGSGGMGVVYRAEQERPRRIVALKLMRQAPLPSGALRRFEGEAELLGRLQHPGIAQIFGAGVAQVGFGPQPYFAMELIDGPSITEFAKVRKLSVRQRLDLMLKVCAAAEHAHTKGVIHRDLKPANILVGADGEPKIVDFGIARAIGAELERDAASTRAGELLGTLSFMSPEQVAGDPGDVDTRADVYALGAVMYQLLADRPARDLGTMPLEQALRCIREEDPPLLGSIQPACKGDLETIVARAMSRERERRYQSAAELADEIRRYLEGEPIEARRDSAVYVIGRRLRRHRVLAAGAALSALGLAAFAVYAWTQSVRQAALVIKASEATADARAALDRAQQEAAALRRSDYFNRIGFAQAAYAEGDSARMTSLLDGSPADLRGWEWSYLKRLSDISVAHIQARKSGMGSMAVASGAGKFVTYRFGEEGILWDLHSRARIGHIGAEGGLSAVAMTPDGSAIATISKLGVQIWSGAGAEVKRFELQPAAGGADITRDGKRLLVTGPGGLIRVLDAATGARVSQSTLPGAILCARFSPDGVRIACGDSTGQITMLDAATGEKQSSIAAHTGMVRCVAFSTEGLQLSSGGEDSTDRIWSVAPGRPISGRLWFRTHTNKVTSTAISPGGAILASGSTDTTIKIVDLRSGQERTTLTGHTATVVSVAFASETELVSTSLDGTVRWWDLSNPNEDPHAKIDCTINTAAIVPSGSKVLVAGSPGRMFERELASLAATRDVGISPDAITHVAVSSDGRQAVTSDTGGAVRLWSLDGAPGDRVIARHAGAACDVAISSTRGWAASVGVDGYLRFTQLPSGDLVHQVLAHEKGAAAVACSPSGDFVATGGTDHLVRIWDSRTWSQTAELSGHTDAIWSAAFTPDGATVIAAGEDGLVLAWPLDPQGRGGAPRRFEGHHGPVYCATTSPDGLRLVTGGYDNTVRLWDLPSGSELLALRGHIGSVRAAAFSPDGRSIVSCSDDGTIRVWRAGEQR